MPDQTPQDRPADTTTGSSFGTGFHKPARDAAPGARSDIPYQVGKYRITKWLGSGGMGEVWLGEDEFGNEVAVKVFTATGPSRENFLKMFTREAHTLSMLQHRNICRVHGVEEVDGRPFIIMEYVQGVDLATLLGHLAETPSAGGHQHGEGRLPAADLRAVMDEVEERQRHPGATAQQHAAATRGGARTLPLQQALSVVIRLCDAVQYAHERGIFHRDIKPSNIIIRRDGEPVLLDFGVAKITGAAQHESFTLTGQFLGTIEYMAPEQELSSKHVDERADVYSIGAVLYELVTGHKFFSSSGNILQDVDRIKDYRPVRPRVWSRHIDRDLQAVILKAVAADKEQRYASAKRLAQDLVHYQEGQPIQAKPPTVLYLTSKFVRRNALGVALSSVIAVLSLLLGAYYAIDYYRHWGNWVVAMKHDFVGTRQAGDLFEFRDSTGAAGVGWPVDSVGLRVVQHHWCWLRTTRVSGNVRVVMRLHFDNMPDGFEIAINSADDSLAQWFYVPAGYSCQVGGYQGTLDFVSVNKNPGTARAINPVPSRIDRTRDVSVVLQREGERVTLYVNGRRQAYERDISPFSGPYFGRIGFRTFASGAHVRSIEVYRMSLPQKASPLIAGDALASAGHGREAVRTYLGIADDYPRTALAEHAVLRALNAVYEMDEPYKSHLRDSVLALFGEDLKATPSWQYAAELQMMDQWTAGRFDAVLRMLPEHFAAFPLTRIAPKLQQLGAARADPPDSVRVALLPWCMRTQGITCLYAQRMPQEAMELVRGLPLGYLNCGMGSISSIEALAGLRLNWLMLTQNRVADLTPLRNQPLAYLSVPQNRVASLEPLAGAPLRILMADRNRIDDVSPLRYCPVEYVSLNENLVRSLEPLRDKGVEYLYVAGNRLWDIDALRGMPLAMLDASRNGLVSLDPLQGARLRSLRCDWNRVSSLAALSAMPLEALSCGANRISSLEPLRGMPLRSLDCSRNAIGDLEPLAGVPLRSLNCAGNRISSLAPLTGASIEYLDCGGNPLDDFGPALNMPLRRLEATGCRGVHLKSLQRLPLRELAISSTGNADLSPLKPLRLTVLDCSGNGISDLAALSGMPLERLNCSDNHLSSLEPLRNVPLTELVCAANRISSLAPLAGKALLQLDCQDNPLTSLEPLVERPPGNFLFFTETLPLSELERAIAAWGANPLYSLNAQHARVLTCIKTRQYAKLRELAMADNGHAYLYFWWRRSRPQAEELCARAGGHLLRLEDQSEECFLRDTIQFNARPATWAGVIERDGNLRWAGADSSEPPPSFSVVHDEDGEWVYQGGRLRKVAVSAANPFVIEWEQ